MLPLKCQSTLRHSYILVFKLVCAPSYCRMASKSVLFEQKCATYITSGYICYICELHPFKSLISFLILSFDKLLMRILDHNTMTLKGNELAKSKRQVAFFYHRNCKS